MLHHIYDAVVIGAGLSGVACARRLAANGIRILMCDARLRVGGRTLSVPVENSGNEDAYVDLGGQWVGPTHWRCLQLVAELRLSTVRQQWLQDSGAADQPLAHTTMLSSGASAPLTPADDAELASVCTTLDTWAVSVRDPAAWPAHPHAAEWDRQSAADYFQRCTKSEAVRRELFTLVRTVLASEPADLSLLFLLYFLGQVGGLLAVADGDGGAQTFRIRGGAQQLSTGMAAQLAGGGTSAPAAGAGGGGAAGGTGGGRGSCELRLGVRVARIEQLGSIAEAEGTGAAEDTDSAGGLSGGVRVHLEPSHDGCCNGAASASCNGTACAGVVTARCVVVAMSPPLWKTLEWSPPLPPAKRAITERMYMGRCVKTIAVFDQAFWSCASSGALHAAGGPGAPEMQLRRHRPPLQLQQQQPQPPRSQPQNQTVSGSTGSRPKPHLEDCGPVANLFPSVVDGRPALVGLVVAAAAASFAALPAAEQRRVVLQQYQQYFGDDRAVAGCRTFLVKDWMGESYSRGCYAALMPPGLASSSAAATATGCDGAGPEQVGDEGRGTGRGSSGVWGCGPDAARAPMWGGRVYFAGTELAREWAGYFEGALESGYRAADEVAAALGLGSNEGNAHAAGPAFSRL